MARGNRARLRSNKQFQKPYNTIKPPKKEESAPSIGPLLIGLFLFLVVGSAIVQILRTVETGAPGMAQQASNMASQAADMASQAADMAAGMAEDMGDMDVDMEDFGEQ
mmetsp:Transcript_7779/g.8921  ORF Transcript_7779/g.8921 Transcript_7779/m.8921 type:complete len:108 (+) Transcript_7779:107-430(+)|eukprot:CAMPEP_0184033692 /NCGR_PEP_ID=MMETSP0955-20130417/3961_1 /TAXON_ID=627963 /ORGANISM="Aplanochytrium sp, Strain PBS07" /LENGTH=107 /DNA_ID=CAMNT_0026320163 /DNA_START=65 /DNA_END=391 /DNA_ORIENTATION=+